MKTLDWHVLAIGHRLLGLITNHTLTTMVENVWSDEPQTPVLLDQMQCSKGQKNHWRFNCMLFIVGTKEVRERAYKSLVRPQVEYAASVWSPWLARDKARIERVQRRAARYVYNTYSRYSSVTAMLQSLDWETLESRRFNMRLCIIYKAYYNLAIFPLSDYATPITVQTRGNNIKFILPHCSKDVFKHSFLPAALRGWNALPQSAVEATSLELFKASLPGVTY